MSTEDSSKESVDEKKEIENRLRENAIFLFQQITKGCSRSHCYNIYCAKNKISHESKFFNLIKF